MRDPKKTSPQAAKLQERAQLLTNDLREAVEMSAYMHCNGKKINITDFIHSIDSLISSTIEKTLHVSKLSMRMVYTIDDAIQNLAAAKSAVVQMEKIKSAPEEIAALAKTLHAMIDAAHANMKKNFSTLNDVAIADMTDTLAAKEELSNLMTAFHEQTADFRMLLAETSSVSRQMLGLIIPTGPDTENS